VVLEIADGLLQTETAWLLERVGTIADAVVFAATDSLSAKAGTRILQDLLLPVRAISGLVTRSPLAVGETTAATGLPVLSPADLVAGCARDLLPALQRAS